MADTNTPNILLLLPDLNDTFNFGAHVEANFTTIDGLMGAVQCTSSSRPTNTYAGQIAYESDSKRYVQNVGTKSSASWTYMSHQALSVASSSRPTSGVTAGELIYESDNSQVRARGGAAWLPNLTSCTSGARPSNPVTGDVALESNTSRLIQWTGSTWLQTAFSNWVTTSSTRPGAPFTGLEIFETDTGLNAVYNGTNYLYGLQQVAATQTLGGTTASFTFSGLNSAASSFLVRWSVRMSDAVSAEQLYLRFNGDSGNNYLWQYTQGNNSTNAAAASGAATAQIQIGTVTGNSATANYWASGSFTVTPGGTGQYTTVQGTGTAYAATNNSWTGAYGGQWLSTAAITSLTLVGITGSFLAKSQFAIYALP